MRGIAEGPAETGGERREGGKEPACTGAREELEETVEEVEAI